MTTRPHLLADSPTPHEAKPVDEFAVLREEIDELQAEVEEVRRGVQQVLAWMNGLRAAVNGTTMPNSAPADNQGAPMPPNDAAWQMWKNRLPPGCGKIIDALLIQPLTSTQMIRVCGMAHRTVNANIAILKGNTLVEKDGDRWKLKRL